MWLKPTWNPVRAAAIKQTCMFQYEDHMLLQCNFPKEKSHSSDFVTHDRFRCYGGKTRSFEMLMSHCLCWMEDLKMQIVCLLSFEFLSLFQVMRETHTEVKWPSKLKIGAKSKKGEWCHSSVIIYWPSYCFKRKNRRLAYCPSCCFTYNDPEVQKHHKSIIKVHSKL